MPSYLWTGKDSTGKEQADRVEAATAEQARTILENRGWTDLRQHTSDINDFVQQQSRAASDPDLDEPITAAQELQFLTGKAPGFWASWFDALRGSAVLFVALSVCFAWAYYRGRVIGTISFGAVLAGLVFLHPVLHFWFGRTNKMYRKLHIARNWRRWDEVFSLLEELTRTQQATKIGIGESEHARYRALALAGKGQLNEAVREFSAAAEKAEMPKWLFYSHLASVHIVANEHEKALALHRMSIQEAPEKGIPMIDTAAFLVQRFNCPGEAKQLMQQAEATQLPEMARPHIHLVHGVIAFRERDFQRARNHLHHGLSAIIASMGNREFIFEPAILLAQGYLAVVEAKLGNKQVAARYHAAAAKYLEVIGMVELLQEYNDLTGSRA
jgi:tetratricopeptide (TPR) repeat protein